jgi:hypothetical protein
MSTNRSSYSQVGDVLIDADGKRYPNDGVLSLEVEGVSAITTNHPNKIVNGGPSIFSLKIEHIPLECNYAHTEIKVLQDGKVQHAVSAKTVKTFIKDGLRQNCKVLRVPVQ